MHVDVAQFRAMRQSLRAAIPARRQRGPWRRLVAELLRLAGPGAEFLKHAERPWWSATFTGARHRVVIAFHGDAAVACGEAYIAALPDHDFAIRGQLVADTTITAVEHGVIPCPRMVVEAEFLLLEDA